MADDAFVADAAGLLITVDEDADAIDKTAHGVTTSYLGAIANLLHIDDKVCPMFVVPA